MFVSVDWKSSIPNHVTKKSAKPDKQLTLDKTLQDQKATKRRWGASMLVHKFIIVTNVMILLNSLVILQHTCVCTVGKWLLTVNSAISQVIPLIGWRRTWQFTMEKKLSVANNANILAIKLDNWRLTCMCIVERNLSVASSVIFLPQHPVT